MIKIILQYIVHNKLIFIVGVYFLFSILLKIFTQIDIRIPCIWKTLFHFECFGCGTTTALVYLLKFDISRAFQSNKLIFIVFPAIVYYLKKDFNNFKKKYKDYQID